MKIEQWFLYFIFICTIFFYNGISCKTKTGRHDIAESGVKHNKIGSLS